MGNPKSAGEVFLHSPNFHQFFLTHASGISKYSELFLASFLARLLHFRLNQLKMNIYYLEWYGEHSNDNIGQC